MNIQARGGYIDYREARTSSGGKGVILESYLGLPRLVLTLFKYHELYSPWGAKTARNINVLSIY